MGSFRSNAVALHSLVLVAVCYLTAAKMKFANVQTVAAGSVKKLIL